MAVNMKKKFPKSWKDNSMAGHDWYLGFMSRNPTLSLRSPETTSMARATGFNEENVLYFFDLYKRILDEHKLECMAIYNMGETGLTTVQTPSKIIAQKGQKQVGSITSAERGTLITLALAVNAIGHTIPPMFPFPRKKYYDYFVRDGPSGSIGVSNGSGWMQEEDFIIFLKHFSKHTRCTPKSKVLLILDNHISHHSYSAVKFCIDTGIILLSLPPHCTHKLQPLDRSVFGPLKKYYTSRKIIYNL
ncbi:uncharacterized protein LOC135924190 [Gordionus sp. m RMFG-2023]|uniref:uncharacterized protein LOC135924190 n=1 Tax=Gordionus sp. m RMFG-2023 TaxID=3053472 RepID=UPI0031FDBC5B